MARVVVLALSPFGRRWRRVGRSRIDVIKALLFRSKAGPAQMPLANARAGIAGLFQIFGQRLFFQRQLHSDFRVQHHLRLCVGPPRQKCRQMQPPRRLPRQNPRPRRRTDRLRAVAAGKSHSLRRHPIQIWRRLIFAAITRQIVDAQIVGKDQDDVGLFRGGRLCSKKSKRSQAKNKSKNLHR